MNILCATGGSGGHIFPALQTALELKKRGHAVSFAGVLEKTRAKIEAAGFPCHHIDAQGFTDRSVGGMFRLSWVTAKALGRGMKIVKETKPDMIVGFGGYGSFPVLMAGIMRGTPTMLHEQNVVCGKANRILARLVRKIAVSFEGSLQLFSASKAAWTGCPCHNVPASGSRADICRSFGLKPESTIIVLMGGSQGSQKLNQVFFDAMQTLRQGNVQAVHITGLREFEAYKEKYKQAGIPVVISAFYSPIEELYAIADIAVARSGAATVSELGAFAIPSVLVPYPFAGNHQKYNARVLSDAGAAILVEQKDLTAEGLVTAIGQCRGPGYSREEIREKVKGLFVADAAVRLADAVERV